MKVQFIKTPSGDEIAILPRADYEALLALADGDDSDEDDAADVAIYDARMAALKPEDILPPEVSALILKGHGTLKAVRIWRGMTQADLAERSKLTQGFISELERTRRGLSVTTAVTLADVLDVPYAWLD